MDDDSATTWQDAPLCTATYSPEDNKLRLYPRARLDPETYARVKAAGFTWAPKQELFVAPMWTPQREDLALELAGGVIEDEDTPAEERAAQRAGRFAEYSQKRTADAKRETARADEISERFYMGQPILVGHHSERQARKAQERMHAAMARAVNLWDTADYWQSRAAGALAAARYKERPEVRARRIKGLESDQRKHTKEREEATRMIAAWEKIRAMGNDPDAQLATARRFAGSIAYGGVHVATRDGERYAGWTAYDVLQPDDRRYKACPSMTPDECAAAAIPAYERLIAWADRWLAHIGNRLAYERAMLAEDGGLVLDRITGEIEIGGQALVGNAWLVITRINRGAGGAIVSLTVQARRGATVGIEAVKDYRAPTAEVAAKVKAVMASPPLANYPGEGIHEITQAQWDRIPKDYRGTRIIEATDTMARHRRRSALGAYVLPRGSNDTARHSLVPVFITDAKVTRPAASAPDAEPVKLPPAELDGPPRVARAEPPADPHAEKVKAMRAAVKAGPAPVIAVPQLFPTPPALAARMVQAINVQPWHRVLEPSAGTGHLLRALPAGAEVMAVEINHALAEALNPTLPRQARVIGADFLDCAPEAGGFTLGKFDRIVMNPPFKDGADITHIAHALQFLADGGRLVAICANGPRQNAKLRPMATTWEVLPDDTFRDQGTTVRTVMLTIDAPPVRERAKTDEPAALFDFAAA